MDTIDPVEAVRRAGGIMRRQELLELVPRKVLDLTVGGGALERHGRSSLALPGIAADRAAAHRVGGTLTGLSAARAWGWKVKTEPRLPVVTVPRDRHHAHAGIEVHRGDLPDGDVTDHRLTRVATVVDCARTLPFDAALAVADSALREGKVTREALHARAARVPRGRARVSRVIESADRRAANPFESVARAIALDVRGFEVEPQGWVGGDRHSDLVDKHLRVAVECDSWSYHADERAWRHDVRRYNEMALDGWLVIRLLWEQVMSQQDQVRRIFERAVALALART
ncbi:hypothetical protein [Nocardioides sp.]|uniref:endonuclease domain-containing protein n=1 Tax=Nocardioides sp. TaxID=35761 RepID=UPI002CEE88DA|nr:hypothetical protein [Nocardioides sp.]HSX66116.1 hypothetical protein [Nocardioides sp.]